MRKYISLLILICSLNIYAAELPPAPQPEALQVAVNAFIEAYGTKENITRMTHWDGSIGSPMSFFMSIPFCCDSKDDKLNAVLNAFVTDENNRLVGIITDGDLRRALQKHVDIYAMNVEELMSRSPKRVLQN